MLTEFEPEYCLLKAGYKKHKMGFIKRGEGGRFHAFIIGFNEIEIHWDKTKGPYHIAVLSAPRLDKEKIRIREVVTTFLNKMREF